MAPMCPVVVRLTDCHCPGMRLDYGCCGVSVIRHAEEGRSYRGSFVEHRLSGVGEAEQSGIEDDADVAAYGAERHAGRRHELGGGGKGVKNKQQMGP